MCDFFGLINVLLDLWIFLNFLDFCLIYKFLYFLGGFKTFFGLFSKLQRLLLKITEVTSEYQKWPKLRTNSMKQEVSP